MLWASLLSPLVFCSTSQQLLHGRPGVLPNISLLVGWGVCGRNGGGGHSKVASGWQPQAWHQGADDTYF